MVTYTCEQCGKTFPRKSNYNSHKRRKTPCVRNSNLLKEIVDNVVQEK